MQLHSTNIKLLNKWFQLIHQNFIYSYLDNLLMVQATFFYLKQN